MMRTIAEFKFQITKPVERKLDAFARRLRLMGNSKGSTSIGADSWAITVDANGYTVLSKNGKTEEPS